MKKPISQHGSAPAEPAVKPHSLTSQRGQSRRKFLRHVSGATTATVAASVLGVPALSATAEASAPAVTSTLGDEAAVAAGSRIERAYDLRVQAALFQKIAPKPDRLTNGDEELYANKLGNFSKGLRHNQLGEVDPASYASLMTAIASANPDDFEQVQMGGTARLTNPQGGLAFELFGSDPFAQMQPPPPAFASAEMAAEIGENYWMALTRDINFSDYDSHPLTNAAAQDLNKFSDFRGPKVARTNVARRTVTTQAISEGESPLAAVRGEVARDADAQAAAGYRTRATGGQVTTGTLFRGLTPGDNVGPYISQFLWKDAIFGAQIITGKMRTVNPGTDYLTSYADWLAAQNGNGRGDYLPDPTPRYMRNGRDLAEWVHIDVLYQAYFNAMLILLAEGAPFDRNHPYANQKSRTQNAFASFGGPHITSLMPGIAACALRAVWNQKWFVHRRLRPEAFGGRIHNVLTKAANYPIHPDILNSGAVQEVYRRFNSYLLPQAFPEGAPTHPAYGAGHATVAGACVTILKAWFDESYVISDPVVASPDGLALVPYRGSDNLTVGGELNKLAANVALGRNIGGVHWRSDAIESLKFGEAAAISMLQDFKGCFNERFDGFSLTKFDGTRITLG